MLVIVSKGTKKKEGIWRGDKVTSTNAPCRAHMRGGPVVLLGGRRESGEG